MEWTLACRNLKEEPPFYKVWSYDAIKEFLYEEPEDLLEDKEAVLKPLHQRILICVLYYSFCAVFTVLYYPLLIFLFLVALPIVVVVHLIQQLRQRH